MMRRLKARIELEFGELVFVEGGKQENPKKNPRSRDEKQNISTQPQPTCDAGFGNRPNPGHSGGRRALSAVHHPYIPEHPKRYLSHFFNT